MYSGLAQAWGQFNNLKIIVNLMTKFEGYSQNIWSEDCYINFQWQKKIKNNKKKQIKKYKLTKLKKNNRNSILS